MTAAGDLLVADVVEPGRYELYAQPNDRWLQATIATVDEQWRWISAQLELFGRAELGRLPGKICNLILCAAEWRGAPHAALERAGLGRPGPWPGIGGNICDACFGVIAPVVRDDGIVLKPPLVELAPHWRPRSCGWRPLGPTPVTGFAGIGRVTQIALHPTDVNDVLAAAAGGGVWRTRDGGHSWTSLMSDQPTLTMGAVAYAPSNPAVIYAASGEDGGGWDPGWPGAGVYRSTDSGGTWTLTSTTTSDRFSAIVVHPKNPDLLYVAGNRGLHKSRDGGVTWRTNPGQSSILDGQITDVVLAHDEPDRVYAGVRGSGVWSSTVGGEAAGATAAFARLDGPSQLPSAAGVGWIKLAIGHTGAHGSDFLLAKLGADGGRLFSTTDGGATWTELAPGIATVTFDEWCSIVAVRPDDEATILVGTQALARTTNGGAVEADWTTVAAVHADQQDLVFSTVNTGIGYLANDGGVYRTSDGGASWTFRSGGMQITQFYDISAARVSGSAIAGGAQDNGIYYRNSVGQWRQTEWGDGTGVAVDPTDPTIVYFSSQNGVPNNLRRSTDGLQSHQALPNTGLSGSSPFVTILKLDPTHPITDPAASRTVMVCGTNQLFRSTNGGQAWQRVEDQNGSPLITAGTITALEYALSDPRILYLGTTTGDVYRAAGGGGSAGDWTLLSPAGSPTEALFPDVPIHAITVDPRDPRHVWLAFAGLGVNFTTRWNLANPLGVSHVYRSTDSGATWQDASGRFSGLSLPDVPTSAVAFHPDDTSTLFVGTDVGVFRTSDKGVTWVRYSEDLPRSPVTDLSVGGNRLFAASMGRGIHLIDI
ncbi:hypothetical protein OF117_09545 [Geodermatophilus sp. YIM 151500]|uniref:WD40/YVTN/BNR-like repeat-containing protein n=1 Tax=Geodermatophilus sp. YIM 151500 TaxID=2984531 RepID=UPI0021E4DE3D|nr:hypothetical protein [Geodermatophilus sp. YIM 151500]MCV2489609.1 hypothetical protein [Geodermatophilus sp. YIM 151500]